MGLISALNIQMINPLTTGAEDIGFFTQLLPHSVLPFKHGKAIMDINQHDLKELIFILSNLNNFHSVEAVDRL